jgi:hypothetical protein
MIQTVRFPGFLRFRVANMGCFTGNGGPETPDSGRNLGGARHHDGEQIRERGQACGLQIFC